MTKTTSTADLANSLFKQNIDFSKINNSIYPKYTLVSGGTTVLKEVSRDKFESFSVHHISEEGILCDDLETYIKWEMFT